MKIKGIAFGAVANLYGQAITILSQIIGVPVLIAHWGLGGFGLWTMLIVIPSLMVTMDFGYSAAASAHMAKAVADKNFTDAKETFYTSGIIIICLAAFFIGASFIIFVTPIRYTYEFMSLSESNLEVALATIPFLGAYVGVSLISGLVNAVYRVNGRYPTGMLIFETGRLIEQVAILLVAIFSGGLAEAALAILIVRIVFLACSAATMVRVTPWIRFNSAHVTMRRAAELFRPAIAAMLVPLCTIAGIHGVTAAIGLVASPAMAGTFAAVRVLFRMITQVIGAVSRAAVPDLAYAVAIEDADAQSHVGLLVVTVLLFGSVFGSLISVAFAPLFISAWVGRGIDVEFPVIALLGVHAVFGSLWNGMSNLLMGLNLQGLYVGQLIIANCVGLVLLALTVNRLEVFSGAMTLATVDALCFIAVLRIWQRNPNLNLRRLIRRSGQIIPMVRTSLRGHNHE